MRRDLSCQAQSGSLGSRDQADASLGADVLQMEVGIRGAPQRFDGFANRLDLRSRLRAESLELGMDQDGKAGTSGAPETDLEQSCLERVAAVIRKGDRASGFQSPGVGQRIAGQTLGERTHEVDLDRQRLGPTAELGKAAGRV